MSPNQGQLPLLEMLRRDGAASVDARLQPLSGGISSDIFLIVDEGPPRVVKRALQQLRVVDAWIADTSRNDFEQRYLKYVSCFMPASVPAVLASGNGYFTMPYFDSAYVTWKSCLLEGVARLEDAQEAGRFLGCVHDIRRTIPRRPDNSIPGRIFDNCGSILIFCRGTASSRNRRHYSLRGRSIGKMARMPCTWRL